MREAISISPNRILVIKLRKLGDVLSTTPALRQIRELYPEAEITFLTEPLGSKVYEHSSVVNHLLILSRKPSASEYIGMCFKIFRIRFDLVIDLYFHSKTALFTLMSGSKYRFGFSKTGKPTWAYNYTAQLTEHDRTKVYCTNHQLKLIEPLGIDYTDNKVEFEVTDTIRTSAQRFAKDNKFSDKTVAFCVLSERSFAQVPTDLLKQIGNYLVKNGYKLYFIYGPNEKHLALKVYELIDSKESCIIDYGIPTVAEQRTIFESCCMFIGNDGGNKHLATAANIPTIGLFYGDNPLVWTPEDRDKHRFLQTMDNLNAFQDFKLLFSKWSFEKRIFNE
ncbi:MAG: glycosyltransferase family 9 protein [Cyclobacteriaceae bacterium]|nr:glycosyltransferase family 9 protein [Cyclobacteriaceae bacterium]